MLLSDIIIGAVNPLYYVFTLTNKIKVPCFITIAMGLVNVIGMFVLIKFTNMGAFSVVFTTLIVNCTHFFDTPLYSAYCLKVKWNTFYPVIIRHLIVCGIDIGLFMAISKILPVPGNWIALLLECIISAIPVFLLSALLILNDDERKLFVKKFAKKFLRNQQI